MRVSLDMTTLTIVLILLREVDPIAYKMSLEDPGGASFLGIDGLGEQVQELCNLSEVCLPQRLTTQTHPTTPRPRPCHCHLLTIVLHLTLTIQRSIVLFLCTVYRCMSINIEVLMDRYCTHRGPECLLSVRFN